MSDSLQHESLPGSSVHEVLQAEHWRRCPGVGSIPFSRGSSQLRDWTCISCIAGGFFTIWDMREALVILKAPFLMDTLDLGTGLLASLYPLSPHFLPSFLFLSFLPPSLFLPPFFFLSSSLLSFSSHWAVAPGRTYLQREFKMKSGAESLTIWLSICHLDQHPVWVFLLGSSGLYGGMIDNLTTITAFLVLTVT